MLRLASIASRVLRPVAVSYNNTPKVVQRNFNGFTLNNNVPRIISNGSLLENKQLLAISNNISPISVRTVTKFSLKKGKRKTAKEVVKRFFRLQWGGWIRTIAGRHKKLWKKSKAQKRRLRQHVLCNSTQSTLLDKMVTKFWKRPRYYVDDPYAPYHTREEFPITRKKPL